MANGRLQSPNLDDRMWQDVVDEARSLIPRYNPEWTDHNASDLGITLMELFAWIVEGMQYRLNRVPDKNFIEFLNLLGITQDPASPATVFLTYQLAGVSPPVTLPKGNVAATQQTGQDAAILFETDADVSLLPTNLTTAISLHKTGLHYENVTSRMVAAPLSGYSYSLVPGDVLTLTLGFDQATALPIPLSFLFRTPVSPGSLQVQWQYSQAAVSPLLWPFIPGVLDGTTSFTQNGVATVTVPVDWAAQTPKNWGFTPTTLADAVDKQLFWVGVHVSNLTANPVTIQIDSILFNSVHASNALTVTQPELAGTGNGKPFQYFDLVNAPLYQRPGASDPYDHLVVQVRQALPGGTFGPWTTWARVDDFPLGAANVFRLDPVMGRLSFGNYDPIMSPQGQGTIPPSESQIQALAYRYVVGGVIGNVPPATITVLRTPVAGLVAVTNPGPAANGADQESIDDTKRRGPEVLRNRYRAVAAEDYEYLAVQASTEVQKVRCLPPRLFTVYDQSFNPAVKPGDPWTYGGLNRDSGNVQVIIIPGSPLSNPTPAPTAELLAEVADYLEQRRSVTAALTVTGPRYLPIKVTAQIMVWKQAVDQGLVPDPATSTTVHDGIVAQIQQFLHPTLGNSDGNGWDVGEDQTIAPLFEFIKPPSAVGFISSLQIDAETPLYTPPTRLYPTAVPGVWVKFADYEMVCSAAAHNVTVTKI